MKQKLILLTLVFGLTIVSQSTLSLGMGNIQVYSSLDEQLRSTIELMTNPDEDLQDLTVKLATSADYKKVGLDKSFVPNNIMVSLDEDDPNKVNVTSNGPISEPIISLLLDVNWKNGRILREFTILLDPPTYDVPTSNVQVNNVVVEPIQEKVIEEPVLQQRVEVEEPQPTYTNEDAVTYDQPEAVEPVVEDSTEETVSTYTAPNDDVYVNEGDTLWSIANNNKLGGLSTNQMMMAIYNNNAGSFIDNNINKLIKGSQLSMPTLDQAEAISYAEALAQVESHHQSWSPEQQDYSSYQTSEDTYTESTDTSSSLDYGVQLSGGDSEGSDSGQTNAELGDSEAEQLSVEDQYNQTAESDDLQERISELEDIVQQQQAVIEVDDNSLANLETQLAEATDTAADDLVDQTTDVLDDVWDEAVDQGTEIESQLTDSMDELSLDIASVDTSDAGDADAQYADDLDDTSSEISTEDSAQTEEVSAAPPKFSVPINQEPSMVDNVVNWVMDNLKWVLIGLGGLVLLLIVPRFLRSSDDDDDETSFLDDIKQRKADAAEGDEVVIEDDVHESADTKVNQPLDLEESDEIHSEDDSEDVLAELDKSITFDENDSADTEDDLFDSKELSSDDSDDFDLDGFLNDGDNDTSVTKDHSETLAAGNFVEDETDEAFEDVSFDDLGVDLDDEIVEEVEKQADDAVTEATDLSDELDLDDLDVMDDLEEVSDTLDESTQSESDVVVDHSEQKNVTDETVSDDDEFSFDEDFDFDLDDDLDDEPEAVTQDDTAVSETAETDSSEDFDDLLDLSDDTETFDLETSDDMDEEIDLGLEGLMDDGDAIDTKLDLAKAYLDMGDTEGAKNLLDEVVSEGSDSQVDEAKKIIDDM